MRIGLALLTTVFIICLPGELPLLGDSCPNAWAREGKDRRRQRARSVKKAKTRGLNMHQRWVHKTYGAKTLKALRRIGITAQAFWYANQNAIAGIKRMKKGKHADGFYLLNKAYKLVPSPNILYHLAKANEAIGRFVQAREQLARFLQTAPAWQLTQVSPKNLQDARVRLKQVEKKLVEIRLVVNIPEALLFLDNRVRGQSPFQRPIWVLSGKPISLVLLKPGYQRVERTLRYTQSGVKRLLKIEMLTDAEAVRRNKRFIELQRRKRAAEKRRLEIQRKLDLERLQAHRKAKRRQSILRLSGWASLGTGGASLLVGVLFAALGEAQFNKVTRVLVGTPWPEVESDFNRSVTFRTVAYATLGAGAALGIAGAVLLYYGYRPLRPKAGTPPATSPGGRVFIVPHLGRGSVGISFGGSL